MEKQALILASFVMAVLLVVSAASASVSIPPANPTHESPGQFLSDEQVFRMEMTNAAAKNCQERFRIAKEGSTPTAYEEALRQYHECMKGVFYYAHPELLPTIELPNGNSPGGK